MRCKKLSVIVGAYFVMFPLVIVISSFGVCRRGEASTPDRTPLFARVGSSSSSAEKPVAREINPPGDIPDNQVFVKYSSAEGGYELKIPEGWARTATGSDVTFTSKLDGLSVTVSDAQGPPDVAEIRAGRAKILKETGRAVLIRSIRNVHLAGKKAVLMVYESNSEPNPVTTKQVRLENYSFFFYRNGKLGVLTVWAPLGADNADQWKLISESFRWR